MATRGPKLPGFLTLGVPKPFYCTFFIVKGKWQIWQKRKGRVEMSEGKWLALIIGGFFVFLFLLICVSAKIEMDTFNSFSDKKITFSQAFWTDMAIIIPKKDNK
jgi:hypothetical protein